MAVVLKIAFAATGIYAAIVASLFLFQSRMIYFPVRELAATPQAIDLEFETVKLTTRDAETLSGWYVPATDPRGTLLFFHGNAGNISHRLESIGIFHQLGLNVLIIDYRGFGQSTGKPTEQGLYDDADAAWRYLTEQRGLAPSSIVLFGRSLGGGVAAWLAARTPAAAVILESTFTSLPDVAAQHYPLFPVRYLTRDRYDTAHAISSFNAPVLIAHSREDELIPFDHGKRLYELASQPKLFLELTGNHNGGFLTSGQTYVDTLDRFLGEYTRPAS